MKNGLLTDKVACGADIEGLSAKHSQAVAQPTVGKKE
jgi:hypothetical protein